MATYFIKKDRDGFYYWILRSDNNYKTVAMSSESYYTKQGAIESVKWTQNNAPSKKIEES